MWRTLILAAALALGACSRPAEAPPAPELRAAEGGATQLHVDGAPFLILGGELGNSSASSLDYMAPIWPQLQALHLNTVLAPVSWEQIEPEEGAFDFTVLDGLIAQARAHELRLVLLWFGSWKNSMSSYAPAWVKRDAARFPRARDAAGRAQEILSPYYPANAEADARAFAALMAHLRETDSAHRTVIMVQVENEIGMLPSARDHSEAANAAWAAQGGAATPAAEEAFMAAGFAAYVETVAAAGKREYAIPMFVNAALPRPGAAPGQYPSAGPLPHLREIWEAGAPSIDFLAPDIYFENFSEWIPRFIWTGNPLFIPEANRAGRAQAPADAFFAFGALDAIGFSPFSIESIEGAEAERLGRFYAFMEELAPIVLAHQGRGTMQGVRAPVSYDGAVDESPQRFELGGYALSVTLADPWTPRDAQNIAAHGGLMIATGPDEFLFAGEGVTITFPDAADGARIGVESAWEGRYQNGAWIAGRLLNGDQTHQGRHIRLPPGEFSVQRVRLYRYR